MAGHHFTVTTANQCHIIEYASSVYTVMTFTRYVEQPWKKAMQGRNTIQAGLTLIIGTNRSEPHTSQFDRDFFIGMFVSVVRRILF